MGIKVPYIVHRLTCADRIVYAVLSSARCTVVVTDNDVRVINHVLIALLKAPFVTVVRDRFAGLSLTKRDEMQPLFHWLCAIRSAVQRLMQRLQSVVERNVDGLNAVDRRPDSF